MSSDFVQTLTLLGVPLNVAAIGIGFWLIDRRMVAIETKIRNCPCAFGGALDERNADRRSRT